MSHSKIAYDPSNGEVSLFVTTNDETLLNKIMLLNSPEGHAVLDAPDVHSVIGVKVDPVRKKYTVAPGKLKVM